MLSTRTGATAQPKTVASIAFLLMGALCLAALARGQVSVTTFHNDLQRSGANTAETVLTLSNVKASTFGKLFAVPVDGQVYAQPLYLYAQAISGGIHNVLYVVTEHDSVYAIDANWGTIYAQQSLIPAGGSTVNPITDLDDCMDLVPEIGITSTPVIDPSTGTLYVVAISKVSGVIAQYLHALDVGTLAEKFGGPVQITASVAGNGTDAVNGTVTFNSTWEHQRAALLLEDGHVIISWGSHCDYDMWHGWLMSYNAATLAQEAVINTSPNGEHGGIWMAGAAPAADASGAIYFATGNGTWNGSTDFSDSIMKLGLPADGTFPVLDYFTPWDQTTLAADDIDPASGGVMLLPTLASGETLLAQQGKAGTIVLLNTANLGKYCKNLSPPCGSSDPQIVEELAGASSGVWGSPAYWNGTLYWSASNEPIQAYSFNGDTGLISTTPVSQSAQVFEYAAPTPTVSANGTTNGILWALDGSAYNSTCEGSTAHCLGLYAYNASNLADVLYTSQQAANDRDSPGVAVKFEKPIVANGMVYVATQTGVSAYGLLPQGLSATQASLSTVDTIDGIGNNGTVVPAGGLDTWGYAYSETLLGGSLTWMGAGYDFGKPDVADTVSNATIALPEGQYVQVRILGTAVNGNQMDQEFLITYTDGSYAIYWQSLSDWYTPQNYAGETQVLQMPYRVAPNGALDQRTFYLYGYSFGLNEAKVVKSIQIPTNRNVVVLSISLIKG